MYFVSCPHASLDNHLWLYKKKAATASLELRQVSEYRAIVPGDEQVKTESQRV
jgi:hypothetical protein